MLPHYITSLESFKQTALNKLSRWHDTVLKTQTPRPPTAAVPSAENPGIRSVCINRVITNIDDEMMNPKIQGTFVFGHKVEPLNVCI